MRSLLGLVFIVSSAAAVALACGATASVDPESPSADSGVPTGPSNVAPDGTTGGLPCDVDAILAARCQKCHSSPPQFGAPLPLVTAADLHMPSKTNPAQRVFEIVPARVADVAFPMPPPPNERLTEAERATLTAWVAAGAPAGTTDCKKTPTTPDPMTACKPDLTIGPATPYTMPTDSGDEYVCYGVELSRPTPTHVVGFAPRIDNKTIVHHVVLYEADQEVSSTPTPCSAGGSLQWRMVTGWAPGGKGFELPPEAGFPLQTTGTTHYVVQMHYSNPQALTGQTDKSGFDLCTAAPRQYEADVLAFGTQKIDIPIGATKTIDCTVPVKAKIGGVNVDFTGLHLIASMPHMHKLGTEMTTQLLRPAGAAEDLGTIKGWSFDTQAWLAIKGDGTGVGSVTKDGDTIKTSCTWKNTTGKTVKFGENTEDEMCYSFTTYYPKIPSAFWTWAAPALASTCTP